MLETYKHGLVFIWKIFHPPTSEQFFFNILKGGHIDFDFYDSVRGIDKDLSFVAIHKRSQDKLRNTSKS